MRGGLIMYYSSRTGHRIKAKTNGQTNTIGECENKQIKQIEEQR